MPKKIHIRSLFKTITFPYINQIYTLSIHKIFARDKKVWFLRYKNISEGKTCSEWFIWFIWLFFLSWALIFFLIQEFVFNRIIYHAKWLFELECFRMRTAKMWTHNSHSPCENMLWFRFRVNKNFIPFSVESEGMVILQLLRYLFR